MLFHHLAGALALATSASAFSDSSPLVLISTSKFDEQPSSLQIQTSSQALENLRDVLSSCPTDRYLLVSQPGVNALELRGPNGCSMPHLCRAVGDSRIQGKFVVSEVIGSMSKTGLVDHIRKACLEQGKDISVDEIALGPLKSDRAGSLADNDDALTRSFDAITSSDSYSILFIGTPDEQAYEAEFQDPVRMDLKRDVGSFSTRAAGNGTIDRRSLFEKYQFFTPGIFMALVTVVVLLSILTVGVKALGSLEVPYGAFDKEMGPAAQKKQQ